MPTPKKANPQMVSASSLVNMDGLPPFCGLAFFGVGRPSMFTKELAETICRLLADGQSLRKICELPGMPDRHTVRGWCDSRPGFYAQYRKAREDQADSLMEEGLEVARKAEDRDQAACANVLLRAIMWSAGKLKPKVYGDKATIEHAGSINSQVQHDVRPSLARMMNDPEAWRKAKDLAYAAGTRPASHVNGKPESN